MRKYFSLLLLGLAVVLASGCYKKARQAEEDDGTGVSNTSKWDWSGEAPISGIIGDRTIVTSTVKEVGKVQNNSVGFLVYAAQEPPLAELRFSPTYNISIKTNLKNGVYIGIGDNLNFNIGYTPDQPIEVGVPPKVYTSKKIVLKLIKNNDEFVEGYFYGKLVSMTNAADVIDVKNGYFKIDKAGTIIQD